MRDGITSWTGVRNYQARNHLRAMRKGDRVLFYHSVSDKAIQGIARVEKEAYPDPTASEGDWSCVDLRPEKAFRHPVALSTIKETPTLSEVSLLKQSRLSVMPLTKEQYDILVKLGNG